MRGEDHPEAPNPTLAPVAPGSPVPIDAALAVRRVATIAVSAILLGFAVQLLILAVTLKGRNAPGTALLISLAQGVTWSFVVCTGVGIGTTILQARPILVGVVAFFCAPIALAAAKASQKVMTGWLGAAEQQAMLSLGTVSVIRAVEYGILGWLLGRLVQASEARPHRFLLSGAAVAVPFGGAVSLLTYYAAFSIGAPLKTPALVATIINEVIFPIGCAFVIYLGQLVGRSLRAYQSASG